jgi:hypothetical protein
MARKPRPAARTAKTAIAKATGHEKENIEDLLSGLAQNLNSSTVRPGDVVFHLSGATIRDICLSCRPDKTILTSTSRGPADRKPLIEVWGDADVIRSILNGERNAVKQFMMGGLRIRGDLRYFSDLALELGILKAPL